MGVFDSFAYRTLFSVGLASLLGNPCQSPDPCIVNHRLITRHPDSKDCKDFPPNTIYSVEKDLTTKPRAPMDVYGLQIVNANMTVIEGEALKNYESLGLLEIDHNALTSTSFLESLPASIKRVSITYNEITDIKSGNFKKFDFFSHLDLAFNKITKLKTNTLKEFSSLIFLGLESNSIRSIELGFFSDLPNLKILSLGSNEITRLENGIFDSLHKIQQIWLDNNSLRYIKSGVFDELPKHLEKISLCKNPLIVDPLEEDLPATALLKSSQTDKPECAKSTLHVSSKSKEIDLCY